MTQMIKNIIFAGFGGQGVLFAGSVLANAGLCKGFEVTWLPSYGPEMRGGTANCSVVISDSAVGSPLVTNPDILVAMNQPSYDKFIDSVVPGGAVIMDSSLIDRDCAREDISICKIPATTIAETENLKGLSNMILMGKLFEIVGLFGDEIIEEAIKKSVSEAHWNRIPGNLLAVGIGQKQ